MALAADVFIAAPDARISILAVSKLTRPYTLTQTDQNNLKILLANGAGHTFFKQTVLQRQVRHTLF